MSTTDPAPCRDCGSTEDLLRWMGLDICRDSLACAVRQGVDVATEIERTRQATR